MSAPMTRLGWADEPQEAGRRHCPADPMSLSALLMVASFMGEK